MVHELGDARSEQGRACLFFGLHKQTRARARVVHTSSLRATMCATLPFVAIACALSSRAERSDRRADRTAQEGAGRSFLHVRSALLPSLEAQARRKLSGPGNCAARPDWVAWLFGSGLVRPRGLHKHNQRSRAPSCISTSDPQPCCFSGSRQTQLKGRSLQQGTVEVALPSTSNAPAPSQVRPTLSAPIPLSPWTCQQLTAPQPRLRQLFALLAVVRACRAVAPADVPDPIDELPLEVTQTSPCSAAIISASGSSSRRSSGRPLSSRPPTRPALPHAALPGSPHVPAHPLPTTRAGAERRACPVRPAELPSDVSPARADPPAIFRSRSVRRPGERKPRSRFHSADLR
jgi:hypothetical protein